MDDASVCTPLLAETDAQNNTSSTTYAASVTDADKVINTNIDSTRVEGAKGDEELLRGLLSDDYCHVCEAELHFESQRFSHYEGKKHAQKIRAYLQAKRAERMANNATGPQSNLTTDKDHFCELCNMVFSSQVVAKSHYNGKVHAKNIRKQGLRTPDGSREVHTLPNVSRDMSEKSASEGGMEPLELRGTAFPPSTEVDLNDPAKYCSLCAASFNNPQMASQHYNGRKHQRNLSRKELLKGLEDDVKGSHLICKMCGVQFNSVEMYQAHMQGNRHQTVKKKVTDLCKSQQKVCNTFADELSDYIQIQKARGITPRPSVLPSADAQEVDNDKDDAFTSSLASFPLTSNPPPHSNVGYYYPSERYCAPYIGPPWPAQALDHKSGYQLSTSLPMKKGNLRKPSASSSHTPSSSSSSYGSTTSDSADSEYRHRDKKQMKKCRKKSVKRSKQEDSDKEEKRRKQQKRTKHKESEERKREDSGALVADRSGKKRKSCEVQRGRERGQLRVEDIESATKEAGMDKLTAEYRNNRKENTMNNQAEMNVELGGGDKDKPIGPKNKKVKKEVESRTEDDVLWDICILGF